MLFQPIPNIDDFIDVDSVTLRDVLTAIVIMALAAGLSALVRRYTKKGLASADGP